MNTAKSSTNTPTPYFQLRQGSNEKGQWGEMYVPECGTSDKPNAPVIYVEREGDHFVLYVWADIASQEPTHKIDLSDAREVLVQKVG